MKRNGGKSSGEGTVRRQKSRARRLVGEIPVLSDSEGSKPLVSGDIWRYAGKYLANIWQISGDIGRYSGNPGLFLSGADAKTSRQATQTIAEVPFIIL